jgi:hypothetical protein
MEAYRPGQLRAIPQIRAVFSAPRGGADGAGGTPRAPGGTTLGRAEATVWTGARNGYVVRWYADQRLGAGAHLVAHGDEG